MVRGIQNRKQNWSLWGLASGFLEGGNIRGLPKVWDCCRFYKPAKHKSEAKSSMISAMSYFSHFNNIKIDENCVIITQESLKIRVLSWLFCKFTQVKPHITWARAEILEPNWRRSSFLPDHTVRSSASLIFFPSGICYKELISKAVIFLALLPSIPLKEEPEGKQNLPPQNMSCLSDKNTVLGLIIFKKQSTGWSSEKWVRVTFSKRHLLDKRNFHL